MANKRIQRKQTKKQIAEEIRSRGGTVKTRQTKLELETELQYLIAEQKRLHRNALQRERRRRYKEEWEQFGIDSSIISKLGLHNKNIQKQSQDIINSILDYNAENKVYKPTEHLALAFATADGNNEGLQNTARYKDMSYQELLQHIKNRRKEAQDNPDGSGKLNGFFMIKSGDKSECQMHLDDFSERGYNLPAGKLVKDEYIPLMNRNDWTKREFAELTACVIDQCLNSRVDDHLKELQYFAENAGLPFDDIFN